MGRLKLKPVSIAGIEFDALIDEQKTLSATIPTYPVETGFPVSDAIILEPMSLQMTLYVSCTPVTWYKRHGSSVDRVQKICEQIEDMWFSKRLVKVVTRDAIYSDMGITSLTISKSQEYGYDRQISVQMQKVTVTKRKTVTIPTYVLKAGETLANAGTASASTSSSCSNDIVTATNTAVEIPSVTDAVTDTIGSIFDSLSNRNHSILYGIADGLNFI